MSWEGCRKGSGGPVGRESSVSDEGRWQSLACIHSRVRLQHKTSYCPPHLLGGVNELLKEHSAEPWVSEHVKLAQAQALIQTTRSLLDLPVLLVVSYNPC